MRISFYLSALAVLGLAGRTEELTTVTTTTTTQQVTTTGARASGCRHPAASTNAS